MSPTTPTTVNHGAFTLMVDADLWEPYTMFPDWDNRRQTQGVGRAISPS